MPKYKVNRTFPSARTLVRGSIIEDPAFRDVGQLVRTGYLELMPEEAFAPDELAPPLPPINETPVNLSAIETTAIVSAIIPAVEIVVENIEPTIIEENAILSEKAAPKPKAKPKAKK